MSGCLIDTSIFIAREQNRPTGDPPAREAKISVATVAELVMGVERASGSEMAMVRETTLAMARKFIPLAFDEWVAERLGKILAAARSTGRRADLMDAVIAATALVHDLVVWTQDDDFAVLAELEPRLEVARA
jgi:predicted nucleic acid-binding protein